MPQRFRSLTSLGRTAALLPLLVLLSACERAVLNPAGDVARQQRDIIYISTGLMLLIIVPVIQVAFDLVDNFESSERGEGGFGSTGKK